MGRSREIVKNCVFSLVLVDGVWAVYVHACLAGAVSNVMDLMMRLSNVKARALVANKVALEAEQAKDDLRREVQALE